MPNGVVGPRSGGLGFVIEDTTVSQGSALARLGSGDAAQNKGAVDGVPLNKGGAGSNLSKPELPGVKTEKVDWSKMDAQSILAILGLEQNKRGVERSESDIKLSMTQQKEMAESRLKEIETATKKAEEAKEKEGSFWSKFTKVLSKAASVVGSLASAALGTMLIATGVGSVVGALLIAHSVSSLACTVMDTLVETGAIKDPGWRPTISSGVAKGLEAAGVDPKVAGIIGMATEIVFVLAINVAAFTSVASVAKEMTKTFTEAFGKEAAKQLTSQWTSAMTFGKAGRVADISAGLVKAGSDIGQKTIEIQVANLNYDSDMAAARAEEIKAAIARLSKTMQMDMETVETLLKRIQANTEAVAETVQGTAEANKSIAANMGSGNSPA
jgi:hypothetical protein